MQRKKLRAFRLSSKLEMLLPSGFLRKMSGSTGGVFSSEKEKFDAKEKPESLEVV